MFASLTLLSLLTAAPPSVLTTEVSGHGRPVLLFPGLACGADVWSEAVAHLKDHYEVHTFTFAGFAGKPAVPGPFLPTVRHALVSYIQEHHLQRPILVGHSLGGLLAYEVAIDLPEGVGGVVAVDSVPFLSLLWDPSTTVASVTPRAEAMQRQLQSMSSQTYEANTPRNLQALITRPEDIAAVAKTSGKSDPRVVGEAMAQDMMTDLRPSLARIQAPVLVLAAHSDVQGPAAQVKSSYEAQVASIPHHRVVVVEHSRHFVMLDAREVFQQQLDAFLAEVTR